MFDEEMMLDQTSEAEDFDNEDNDTDSFEEEEEVWEFEDDEEKDADNSDDSESDADSKTEETDKTEEEQEQEAEEQTSDAEEMFPYELTVFGEKKQVTMSDAKNLVQKGLAYDNLKEKYAGRLKDAYADPRIAFVDELAKNAGVEVSEFMATTRLRNEYNSLIEEFGGLDAVPESMLKLFTDNQKATQEKMAQQMAEQQKKQKDEAMLEELEAFRENHPDVNEISPDIIDLVVKGESLEGAYARVNFADAMKQISELTKKNEELEQTNKILKQNNKNKQTKLPSSRSNAVKEDELIWEYD